MRGKIENINGKIVFSYADGEYELRSHPYEPCLYICKNDEMIKILHNAFEAYDLPEIFDANETVRAITAIIEKAFEKRTFPLSRKLTKSPYIAFKVCAKPAPSVEAIPLMPW